MEQGRLNESALWLERSRESLAAARYLSDGGFHREALSRVYYSMFYAARALLVSRGIDLHRHSAVIAAVGREFVRTGVIHLSFHRAVIAAFQAPGPADYVVVGGAPDPR